MTILGERESRARAKKASTMWIVARGGRLGRSQAGAEVGAGRVKIAEDNSRPNSSSNLADLNGNIPTSLKQFSLSATSSSIRFSRIESSFISLHFAEQYSVNILFTKS